MTHKKALKNLIFLVLFLIVLIAGALYDRAHIISASYSVKPYEDGVLQRLDIEGHAIEQHVGKSNAYLQHRLDTESIPAASTFVDLAEAEEAVQMVLAKNNNLISIWLDRNKSNKKVFYTKSNKPTGLVLKRGWNEPRAGNQTRVVLIRDNDYREGFFILTAYPEIR